MRYVIYPKGRRVEPEDETGPHRVRRLVLEALYDQDLAAAHAIITRATADAAAAAAASGAPDPAMDRVLAACARDYQAAKAQTLKRLKRGRRWRTKRTCVRCLTLLDPKNTSTLCPVCKPVTTGSPSVRTVSGGLPTLGRRRR